MTRNIYYKQSDITASLSELMLSPWALECNSTRTMGIQEALHLIQDMINGEVPETMKIPAAHVTEVKFGDWIVEVDEEINTPWLKNRYCCSECGNWQSYGRTPFCPNCGAKMSVRRVRNEYID